MNAPVFPDRLTIGSSSVDEWDRLPWLRDDTRREPRPVRRTRVAPRLLIFYALLALVSYSAGRISLRIDPPARPDASPTSGMSLDDGTAHSAELAARMTAAYSAVWPRPQRPDAPY